jgi:hypothetical protein
MKNLIKGYLLILFFIGILIYFKADTFFYYYDRLLLFLIK